MMASSSSPSLRPAPKHLKPLDCADCEERPRHALDLRGEATMGGDGSDAVYDFDYDDDFDDGRVLQRHFLRVGASASPCQVPVAAAELRVDLDLWTLPEANAAAAWIIAAGSPPSPSPDAVRVTSLVLERGDPVHHHSRCGAGTDAAVRVADALLAAAAPSLLRLEADLLAPSVVRATRLQSLSVDLAGLDLPSFDALRHLLGQPQGPALKEVSLRGGGGRGPGGTPSRAPVHSDLLHALSHHPLERLELQLNFAPRHPSLDEDVRLLLHGPAGSTLQHLSLEHSGARRHTVKSDWPSLFDAAPNLQTVDMAGWDFPEYAYDCPPWEGPHLRCLHLTDCGAVDFGPLYRLRELEELRLAHCRVSTIEASDWTAWFSRLTSLKRVRLESLDLENAVVEAIAHTCGHWDYLSLGPIYNARQTFPALGEVVRNARGSLHLYGGGSLDCNLIHVARGLGSSHVQYFAIENYACSKGTFALLFRKLYQCGSAGSLRSFALSLVGSPHMDLLPVVALLQSNPPRLKSLSLDPPLVVRPEWAATLARAAHLNTTLEAFRGLDCSAHPDLASLGAELNLLWHLNKWGRRVLQAPNAFPPALWPRLLARVVGGGGSAREQEAVDPSPATVAFYFLRHLPRVTTGKA